MSGSSSTTQQQLPPWALGSAQSLLGAGMNYSMPGGSPAPFNPALQAQVAPFNAAQQAGIGAVEGAAGPSAGLAAGGANELSNTMAGKYLDPSTNPFLKSTFDAASAAATNQYSNATAPSDIVAAQRGGVAGGSAAQEGLAMDKFGLGQNLTNMAAQIYGGNYANERGIQAQAPGQVGGAQAALAQPGQQMIGAGTLQQGQTQAGMDVGTQNAQLKQQWIPTMLSFASNLLGGVTSGGGQMSAGTNK